MRASSAVILATSLLFCACGTQAAHISSSGQGRPTVKQAKRFGPPHSTRTNQPRTQETPLGKPHRTMSSDLPVSTASAPTEIEAKYPAAGDYRYTQTGFEQLCSGSCDRKDLPSSMVMAVSYASRLSGGMRVITEGQVSQMRFTRDMTDWTPTGASVDQYFVRFTDGPVQYENSYSPGPPVRTLHLPLRGGDQWSGSWSAQTSGTYSVCVRSKDSLVVGGRPVFAYQVETRMMFSGEFHGSEDVTLWIDPASLTTVRAQGTLNVQGLGGAYKTQFDMDLQSAPGF